MRIWQAVIASASPGLAAGSTKRCKNNPYQPEWPGVDEWHSLNQSTAGVLIKAAPAASACYANNPFSSNVSCETVRENWFYSSLHSDQPESIGYPYWANNSCVPPNDYAYRQGQRCELGGFPEYILNATTTEQIAIAVKWASSRNIRIVIKGTGHDLNGRSSGAYALSIWTRQLQSIEFNAEWPHPSRNTTENVVKIGTGNNWGNALAAAAALGRTLVSGQDPTVGLGGFIGGGGNGPLSSRYGLSADQVLQATIVTSEGQILTVNDQQHQDLLWAVRGGGPGLYGVVVEYVLRTHPLPENVVLGGLSLSLPSNKTDVIEASWDALAGMMRLLPDLMDMGVTGYGRVTGKKMTSNGTIMHGVGISMTLYNFNSTAPALKALLDPVGTKMLAYGREKGIQVTISEPTVIPNYMSLFDVLNPYPSHCADISLVSTRLLGRRELTEISHETLKSFLKRLFTSQKENGSATMVIGLQGGPGPRNVEESMRGALTPAWRNAYLHVLVTGADIDTANSSPQEALIAAAEWTEEHKEKIWREWAPDSGSYINEANPFNSHFQHDFYGGNYERLVEVKRKYDPTDSLYVRSGVGSHAWDYDLNSGLLCQKV